MKVKMTVLFLCCALVLIAAAPSGAHDYDRNDSDNPLRIVSYIVHPIGVLLEYAITRPVHKLVHIKGVDYVAGHEVGRSARVVVPPAPIMRELEPMVEESKPATRSAFDDSVEMVTKADRVEYIVVGDVLFKPGSAELSDRGKGIMSQLAQSIKKQYPDNEITLEGYTDTQPIRHSGWKSNWELGSARALTLLHFLQSNGFSPEKLSAVTYGQYQGRAPNDSPENMALNRRAVISVKTKKTPAE